MKKIHRERLLKLAEIMEQPLKEVLPVIDHGIKKFDLASWHCGTAACAVGFAMFHPWFNRRGLKATFNPDDSGDSPDYYRPTYKSLAPFYSAQEFFGLDVREAERLFLSGSYVKGTRKEVAKRIREFVQNAS